MDQSGAFMLSRLVQQRSLSLSHWECLCCVPHVQIVSMLLFVGVRGWFWWYSTVGVGDWLRRSLIVGERDWLLFVCFSFFFFFIA